MNNELPLILPSEPGLPSSLHSYPISFVGTLPFCRREKAWHLAISHSWGWKGISTNYLLPSRIHYISGSIFNQNATLRESLMLPARPWKVPRAKQQKTALSRLLVWRALNSCITAPLDTVIIFTFHPQFNSNVPLLAKQNQTSVVSVPASLSGHFWQIRRT